MPAAPVKPEAPADQGQPAIPSPPEATKEAPDADPSPSPSPKRKSATQEAPETSSPAAEAPHVAAGQAAISKRATALKLRPLNDFRCTLKNNGCVRTYTDAAGNGKVAIYWTAASGAHAVDLKHSIYKTYRDAKFENGKYGYPVADMTVRSDKSATQRFQGGTITYTPAHIVAGKKAIDAKAKKLKLVAVNDLNCRLVGNGCVRTYAPSANSSQRVAIYWTAKTGARSMDLQHRIYKKFKASGYERGTMGYPTSDPKCGLKAKGCVQTFQNGTVAYSSSTGARILTAQMNHSWKARGSQNGKLGYPMQDAVKRSGKTTQVFQGGSLVAARVGAVMYPKNECWAIGAGKTRYAHGWANRISFTIAEKYGTAKASFVNCVRIGSIYKQEWKTGKATVGLKGFKRPGVASGHTQYRWSPQGSFTVHEAFGEGNPGTDLKYKKLNKKSRWSGTRGSSYNKYYESGSVGYERWPDENMWFYMRLPTGDYRQGAVIDYNRGPGQKIKQGAGFAIFLHANPVPTAGCIALELKNVVRYLKTADPGDRIIMGVRKDIFKA
ncbi:L,D-transpeptidase family protein [Arthrobacter sp. NPDC055138]